MPNVTHYDSPLEAIISADAETMIVSLIVIPLSFLATAANMCLLYSIWRGRLLHGGDTLYILTTFAMVDPTVRLVYCTFIWLPTNIFKYTIITEDVMYMCTMSALACFSQTAVVQTMISLNRYWLVSNNPLLEIFTRRFCIIYCVVSLPIAHFILIMAYKFFPCCSMVYDADQFTLRFDYPPPGGIDYVINLIFTPFCTLGSIVPVYCYLRIFFITRKGVRDPSVRTFEFCLIFIFYIAFFLGLKMHMTLPQHYPRFINAFIMVCGICDACSIAVILGVMNKRIRNCVKETFGFGTVSVSKIESGSCSKQRVHPSH